MFVVKRCPDQPAQRPLLIEEAILLMLCPLFDRGRVAVDPARVLAAEDLIAEAEMMDDFVCKIGVFC